MFDVRKMCAIGSICLLLTLICCGCQAQNDDMSSSLIHTEEKTEGITLNLAGTRNTRDLGGYKTADGRSTKRDMFFRSDNTDKLTDEDIKKLKETHGLKYVIDLRYDSEIASSPDRLQNVDGITYYNIPLYISKEQLQALISGTIDLGDGYIESLNQKETVKKIFDTFASMDGGSVLFHCTNGKDRTGMVSAMLLGLCGVSDEDIVSNYSVTYELIKDSDAVQKGIEKYGTDSLFKSSPEYMEKLLAHINNHYESVEGYLSECGVSQDNLEKIKGKFIV